MNAIRPNPASFLTAAEMSARASADESPRGRRSGTRPARPGARTQSAGLLPVPGRTRHGTATLLDEAGDRRDPHDGAIVGLPVGRRPLAGRDGLEFKRVSDRVRLNVPGEFESLTLAAWVRPDALPNQNNSLMMADGWETGELHWQIGIDGTVILGVKAPPELEAGPMQPRGALPRLQRVHPGAVRPVGPPGRRLRPGRRAV